MGICSGIIWALAVVRIRKYQNNSAIDMTFGFFFWSAFAAIAACVVLASNEAPTFAQIQPTLFWLFPFMAIVVIPGAFASLWGPKFVSPGLASLLMMTEIIFGSITAALFANEPFGLREVAGVLLISAASLIEPLHDLMNNNLQKKVHTPNRST
jgi:drug/metabolite transporter (DMT)-like permease